MANYPRDPAPGDHEESEHNNPELMAELVMKLFDARTSTHALHLTATSYEVHVALGAFYDEIATIADVLAEAWQGAYQELLKFPDPAPLETDPLASIKALREWIEENRAEACDDSEIQNIIDEAMQLIDSTMYKLRFLK